MSRTPGIIAFCFLALLSACPAPLSASVETQPTGSVEGPVLLNTRMATELRGGDFPPPGTIYVGHGAGAVGAANYWGVTNGGRWTWDGSVPHGDSLFGWWPMRIVYSSTGGMNVPDWRRPWWSIDIGNNANYTLNQGVSHKRTFGVTGVWHRDNGFISGGGVNWAPLGASWSAWMGLRRHGDVTFLDPWTGNPFNADVLQFNGINAWSPSGNDKHFPGYGSQMDEMLYRDIDISEVPAGVDLTLTFSASTYMSEEMETASATQAGWFEIDPLQVTDGGAANAAPGNFINATAPGPVLPVDALIVYAGAPVIDSLGSTPAFGGDWFLASDGVVRRVHDTQRRWFSEVVRVTEGLSLELTRLTGVNPPGVYGPFVIPAAFVADLQAEVNKMRVVFRVKTNRGFDDEGLAFTSCGQGAAVVDDVTIGFPPPTGPIVFGDFETPFSIDNDPDTNPLDAWKSTGRPPGIYSHRDNIDQLIFEDLCGYVGGPDSQCEMSGNLISMGDHDNLEAAGGLIAGAAERNLFEGLVSPTIQLAAGVAPNRMGLTADQATATDDYYVDYEIYTGALDFSSTGCAWRVGAQSYPANQCDGTPDWGQLRFANTVTYDPSRECFRDLFPLNRWGLIRTSNPGGVPDSLRIFVGRIQQCFRFGVTTSCSPTDGIYVDNVALAIVDGTPSAVTVEPWDWYQDTFPANEGAGLPGTAAFDLQPAIMATNRNEAPQLNSLMRLADPADVPIIRASHAGSAATRVDLVFRILPGPGNYAVVGAPGSPLRAVPGVAAAGAPGDLTNFWQNYLAFNGPYGTPGGHGPAWNPSVWNSAQCDTFEQNVFAHHRLGVPGGPRDVGAWMATYHEADPKGDGPLDAIPQLGLLRNRCFVAAADGPVDVLDCAGVPAYMGAAGVATPPCLPAPVPCPGPVSTCPSLGPPPPGPPCGTGFDGSVTTTEYTKILPDNQFTPGTHVEYYFQKLQDGGFAGRVPDPDFVYPQRSEGSLDGHRWQDINVLPDAWKDPAYLHPVTQTAGLGRATMLVVDAADRRGDERAWVSAADSTGATEPGRFGAHNGWHAAGDQSVNDPAVFVDAHLGQAGTTWDLYQVRGGEGLDFPVGTIGSRLSSRVVGSPDSRQGPTPAMLAAYYRMMLYLSSDQSVGVLGPFADRSQNDAGLLSGWLGAGSPVTPNRGLWVMGDRFAQAAQTDGAAQLGLLRSSLGTELRGPYRPLSENTAPIATLTRTGAPPDLSLFNECFRPHDVLERWSGLLALTSDDASYEDTGFLGPYVASVYKSRTPASPWIARTDGLAIGSLVADGFVTPPAPQSAQGGKGSNELLSPPTYLSRPGRMFFVFRELEQSFGTIGTYATRPPVPLDVPAPREVAGDFLRIRGTPTATTSLIEFGLRSEATVEVRVYDVSGRAVRTLARSAFPAGPASLRWDGRTDDGSPAHAGVYLVRLASADRRLVLSEKLVRLR